MSFLVWAAVAALLIGFSEEVVFRGLIVTAFRVGHPEVIVWLGSTAMFSLLHLGNMVLGQSGGDTVSQLIYAFVNGSILYVCRRATGTLVVPILLHAGWDWAGFTATSDAFANAADFVEADGTAGSIATLGLIASVLLTIVGLVVILRSKKPPSDEATAAA